jgi:hypothetical protein
MSIGQAYTHVLSSCEQKALATGCSNVIDQTFDDFALMLMKGQEAIDDTTLILHLPRRYILKYDTWFVKQFLICILTVAWKLAQPKHHPLG